MLNHPEIWLFNGRLDYAVRWSGICNAISEIDRAGLIGYAPGYDQLRDEMATVTYLPNPLFLCDDIYPILTYAVLYSLNREDTGIARRDGKGGFYAEVSPQQLYLDELSFNQLGLTRGERDAVYEGVYRQVVERNNKSRTIGRQNF